MSLPLAALLIRKLDQRDTLSDEEKQMLESSIAQTRTFAADEDMVREHERPPNSTLLLEGWAARYKVLRDGRRQIQSIHIAGDFVDLQSFPLKKQDHSVLALTPCQVAQVPHEALGKITDSHPHLTRLLWANTLVDAAIHRQWLVGLGRQSAIEHIAHLICEMLVRLQVIGQAEDHTFRFPLTQAELGDTLGISTVHVNRVLKDLRQEGLVTWRGERVEIKDWDRLCDLAEFDPTYLHLETEPR